MSSFRTDALSVHVHSDEAQMALAAAQKAAAVIAEAVAARGFARVILATAASQVEFFRALVCDKRIDWGRVTVFHLDEFLGISEAHPSGFGHFLNQHLLSRIPVGSAHKIQGDSLLPLKECARYEALLRKEPIDLCCVGVGENGHIAFNDPDVADFEEEAWVKIVKLDDRCRDQQVKDRAFSSLPEVPLFAYTLTIPAIRAARQIVGVVPGRHKAEAVARMIQTPVSKACPASILRLHPRADLYLDAQAAERLLIA